MGLPPTLIKLLGWIPWRSLGLLPANFRGLQGRPKHSRAAWEESEGAAGHGPSPNRHNALRGATCRRVWGCHLGMQLSPAEANTLLQTAGRSHRELPDTDLPSTGTKLFNNIPRNIIDYCPRLEPSPEEVNTLLVMPSRNPGELPGTDLPLTWTKQLH